MHVIEVRVKCDWKEDVEKLCSRVLSDLGHDEWRLRWLKHDAYCWRVRKIIDICPCESKSECLQMILHEVAHIDVVESCANQHTKKFWQWLEQLVYQYLEVGLNEGQLGMARICCPGFEQGLRCI